MTQPGDNTFWQAPAKTGRRWCFYLLVVAFVTTTGHTSSKDTSTEQQLETLNRGISKLEQWLKDAQTKKSGLQTKLQRSEKEAGKIAQKIRKTAKNIRKTLNRLDRLKTQRDQLRLDRLRQENLLAKQIRASYYLGSQEYIKVLLNQEQPERLARTLKYYDYFNRARTQQIETHNKILEQLKLNQLAIETENQTLTKTNKVLLSQQNQLIERHKERRAILVRLEGDIKNSDAQLTGLLKNREQLEQLILAVKRNIPAFELTGDTQPIKQLKGKLPWPTKGKILHRYGTIDQQTGTRWNGLMISANEGQDIQSIYRGHIVFADWLRGYGLLIIIDHGEGYMSLYGHNQALYKQSGDWVGTGEIIAGMGSSGGMRQTHLYFEIRRDGKPQNPQKWMVASK